MPATCNIYVPTDGDDVITGAYKSKSVWSNHASYIKQGAYDYSYNDAYHITITDANPEHAFAKLVYWPGTLEYHSVPIPQVITIEGVGDFNVNEIGDRTFKGVALGYGSALETIDAPHIKIVGAEAFRNNTTLRSFNFSNVTHIGYYAFKHTSINQEIELPSIQYIGTQAIYECPLVHRVTLYGDPLVTTGAFGYTAEDCLYYVDARQFHKWLHLEYDWVVQDNMVTVSKRVLPFVKLSHANRIFSCELDLSVPSGAEFYTVPSYDASRKVLTTSKWTENKIPANSAMLMKGNPGSVYRFNKYSGGTSTSPSNLLIAVAQEEQFLSSADDYVFDEEALQFVIAGTNVGATGEVVNSSYGYLHLPNGGMSVDVALFQSSIKGDVNGDGKVNVTDVTALINIILGAS